MGGHAPDGLRGQVLSLQRKLRQLREESERAAAELIRAAGERRSARRPELERMLQRLAAEVERLEEETRLDGRVASPEDVDRRLDAIEQQLREVLAERDAWIRESLRGRRRRAEDLRVLDGLREEQERLTAELFRCARQLQRAGVSFDSPVMRRLRKMLRLSGT
jgi:malonyl CoA-acyl carrier protein transacylase